MWSRGLQSELRSGAPANLSGGLSDNLCTRIGLQLDETEATIDPSSFAATRAEAQSLAVAALITGGALAALRALADHASKWEATPAEAPSVDSSPMRSCDCLRTHAGAIERARKGWRPRECRFAGGIEAALD